MKLTLNMLAARMAADHGVDTTDAEAFVSSYFAEISELLTAHGEVKIKGLGTFHRKEAAGEIGVEFAPDAEMADTVNAPFSFFEAVELNDAVTDEMLLNAASLTAKPESEPETEQQREPQPEPEEAEEAEEAEVAEPEPAVEEPAEIETVTLPEPEPEQEPAPEPETKPEPQHQPQDKPHTQPIAGTDYLDEGEFARQSEGKSSVGKTIAIVAGLAACLAIGFFAGAFYERCSSASRAAEPVVQQIIVTEGSVKEVAAPDSAETRPAETNPAVAAAGVTTAVVTDTIRAAYYMTHMAKKFYGNKHFWSYIYEENRDKLGHPELTPPGTVVVIPPAEKYAIDASNPESVKAAKALAVEIYGRFSRR